MARLILNLIFAALLLTTGSFTAAVQDDPSYRLRLASSLGEPKVQAIAGQLPFNVQVKPRLAKHHALYIETKDGKKVEDFAACDPYQLMADSFAKKIRGQEAWLLPLEESVKFSEFFDSVFTTLK